ncbi:DNA translocase FtsK 4TM domain-containing protein [Candidatus Blochmannia ocreatus (nom. nud.)]|uniref:DNA translocase FtsK n=1 Tax=Candidatus Blochmannia ocreatus (nom. nud.) TaxID=251538 RepID=UPI003C6C8016
MIIIILVSTNVLLLYLIIILLSFSPNDPGWMQSTWHGSIYNLGGLLGARIADFLFFVFGISAYIVPIFILFYLWRCFFKRLSIDFFNVFLKLVRILASLFALCSIMHLVFYDFFYFDAGGIIGSILCDCMSHYTNFSTFDNLIIFLLILITNVILSFYRFFGIFLNILQRKLFSFTYNVNILMVNYQKILNQFNYKKFYKENFISFLVLFYKNKNFLTKLKNSILNIYVVFNILKKNNELIKMFFFSIKKYIIYNTKKVLVNFWIFVKKLFSIYDNDQKKNHNVFIESQQFLKKKNKNKKIIFDNVKEDNGISQKKIKNKFFFVLGMKIKPNIIRYDHEDGKEKIFYSDEIMKNISSYKYKKLISVNNKKLLCKKQPIIFPDIKLLTMSPQDMLINFQEFKIVSQLLEEKLLEYRISAHVVNITAGPVLTRFELNLSPGVKSSRISGLSRDLARVLSIASVRVVEVIPGTPYVGLEIPNKIRSTVCLGDIIVSDQFRKINHSLPLVLGKDISGVPLIVDLRSMPHLLIAGTTGSGKSVSINSIIIGLLYRATPKEVRFIMIDPKMLELSVYSGLPHLLKPVVTDVEESYSVLQWCIEEMERRYKLMVSFGVRNLEQFNSYVLELNSKKNLRMSRENLNFNENRSVYEPSVLEELPYIIIVIDEFADLIITIGKRIEELVVRLTQKARAAGIHMILATQRPSVNVITGLIKANIPARVAFTVSSTIDSRTILGHSGAELLLGMGDMLYLGSNSSIFIRAHGAFVSDKEIYAVVNFWKSNN